MYCAHCGAQLPAGAGFCPGCGTALGPATPERSRRGTWVLLSLATALVLVVVVAGGLFLLLRGGEEKAATAATTHQRPAPSRVAHQHGPRPTETASVTVAAPEAPNPGDSFADLYRDVSDGVVRIETQSCDRGGVGSGFLLAPDLVATAAHVVEDGRVIAVRQGHHLIATGTVVGIDEAADLALVRTSISFPGHVFDLGTADPAIGDDVAVIGYPMGGPKSFTKGTVSGLRRTIHTDGGTRRAMIQTDAAVNPGNSGGPMLDQDGTVVGVVDAVRIDAANMGYAVSARTARGPFAQWQQAPTPVHPAGDCEAPTVPDGVHVDVLDHSGHPDGPAIAEVLSKYANGINTGDWDTAYGQFTPAERGRVDYDDFVSGSVSTYIITMDVDSIDTTSTGDTVEVRFTSLQDASAGVDGQECSEWSMTYTLVQQGGRWLIDGARPHPGSPSAC